MFVVGLTGGIGSGKTAATNAFKQLGITIVDADIVAREVVEPGSPALAKIAAHFGDTILLADGQLDRAALRERIFNNADEKKWLEALLHPLINAETARQLKAANSAYVIYVSPLLIDGGQQQFCQRIVVVDVPEEQQITRTMSRDGNDRALVEKILASQINRQIRLAAASDIIDNSGDLNQLNTQVEQLHLQFLQLAKQETQ